jgi:tetratricopeptide (TPR) repeat protein
MRVVTGSSERQLQLEQPLLEREVLHLRKALASEEGLRQLPDGRVCQILTNLGNALSAVGRIVEALEYWNRALQKIPSFPMALGNRGHGLSYYAGILYDVGHQHVFLQHAHADLSEVLSPKLRRYLEGNAHEAFEHTKARIEAYLPQDHLKEAHDVHSFSLGDYEEEVAYRKWCLEYRLFLNPLNDLGPHAIAARDVFSQPSITTGLNEGPYYLGLYNQMKQEFVSARYLYYEGTHTQGPHYSDMGVRLYNTLDYPAYSLSAEKVKAAFRAAYSLFDKTAFFLNRYLELSIPEKRITFRTFWYERQEKKRGLGPLFREMQNWPLRGLFWLGKDLYEDEPGFREATEPDAQELAEVRNHLEHKYLKLHEDLNDMTRAMTDTLAFSVYRYNFETKTLRLLKMVRAALIYLSLAIHQEEVRRAKDRDPNKPALQMESDVWEDEWKL